VIGLIRIGGAADDSTLLALDLLARKATKLQLANITTFLATTRKIKKKGDTVGRLSNRQRVKWHGFGSVVDNVEKNAEEFHPPALGASTIGG
jgi:hypothetical protein